MIKFITKLYKSVVAIKQIIKFIFSKQAHLHLKMHLHSLPYFRICDGRLCKFAKLVCVFSIKKESHAILFNRGIPTILFNRGIPKPDFPVKNDDHIVILSEFEDIHLIKDGSFNLKDKIKREIKNIWKK